MSINIRNSKAGDKTIVYDAGVKVFEAPIEKAFNPVNAFLTERYKLPIPIITDLWLEMIFN